MPSNFSDIRKKLVHGLPPLTLAEQRWLYAQATGEILSQRKRCASCEGEGLCRTLDGGCATIGLCPACNGNGYES